VSLANTSSLSAESAAAPQKNPFEAVQYSDDEPTVDWDEALDGTDALVERFRQENYVDVAEHFETDIYEGYGELVDDTTIEIVDGPDKGIRITGEKTLVATGSSPWVLPIDGLDGVDYYTSETILKERNLPGSIVIIGGGYIAPLRGQILHRIGVDVTILQRSERVLSGMEGQLGREMQRAFEEEGIKVITGNDFQRVRAPAVDGGADAIQSDVGIETLVDGNERTVTGDALFVATGVQPNSEDIGLETVGVEANDDGAILVDEHFQTANPDVYAAGDVIGEPELETVAAKEGNHAIKTPSVTRELPSTTTRCQQSCSPARRLPLSGRPNWSTWTNTVPVPAAPSRWRTCRGQRPSRTPMASFRSSNTTKLTRSSASIWSVPAPPT